MRALASGFTCESLSACLNCIARVASVTAKRANFAEARLRLDFDPTNGCCKATPLKLVGHLSAGRSRSRDAIQGTSRKKPTLMAPDAQRSGARLDIRTLRASICSELGQQFSATFT